MGGCGLSTVKLMKATLLKTKGRQALTLIEMLVSIAIVIALLALIFPQYRRMVEASRQMECISRLKQIGVLFHGYASEQEKGVIALFRDGNANGSRRWYTLLRNHAGLTNPEAKRQFGCPSMPVDRVSEWFCYGMRVNGSPGRRVAPGLYELPYRAVENPAQFLLAADTVDRSGRQTFRIIPPGLFDGGGVHLRHQERAVLLFLDGHVETRDAAGLYQLGITEAYNGKNEVVTTRPEGL